MISQSTYIRLWPFALSVNEGGRYVTFSIIPQWGIYFRLYVGGVVFSVCRSKRYSMD